jgi:ribonuclease PH
MEVLDLNYEEDSTANTDMNIVMTGSGKFIEIQGTAERDPFGVDTLGRMLKLGQKGINELIAAQKAVLEID